MEVKPGHLVRVCTGLCCRLTGATDHVRALAERLAITHGQSSDGRVTLEEASCLSVCSLAPVVEVDDVCHGPVTSAAIDRLPMWYRTRPPWPVDVDASNFPRVESIGKTARERLTFLRSQAEARTRLEWRFLVQGGSCGEALGAGEVLKALRLLAAIRGLDAEVLDGACHGLCTAGIVVEVQRAGWPPLTFTHLTTDMVPDFLSAIAGGPPPLTRFSGAAWNGEGWRGLPPASRHPFFGRQRRVILERCGHIHPVSLGDALLAGAYSALAELLDRQTATVKASAGLVVSGEEGIPGVFMDRHLMEGDPHRVLEALAIAGWMTGTTPGILQINGAARWSLQRMTRALAKAQASGLIGDRILGSAFSFHVEIRQEACGCPPGEERRWNVATLAALPSVMAESDAEPVGEGRRATKLCSVSGAVERPGVVEIDGTVTLRELLSDVAGGLRERHPPPHALVVGPSGVPVSPESLDAPVESLAAFAAGAGGVIAIPDDDPHASR